MRFTKMHGLGNDYVYVNCFEERVDNPTELARLISDRHFGVGSDGLILIGPSETADVRMRIFNADGSEAEMCGNGIRCVAKYAIDHGLATAKPLNIETGNGVLSIDYQLDTKGRLATATVNMGQPILRPEEIPVNIEGEKVVDHPIEILGHNLAMTCVSMGNPHAIFFCDNVQAIELERLGPAIESHSLFPNRTNVHFAEVYGPDKLAVRTWERGSGITLACGTGACAVCVAAVLIGHGDRSYKVQLPGGILEITWSEKNNCVYMTGPAVEVFQGIWPNL